MPLVDVDQCESCGRKRGERHLVITSRPDAAQLAAWTFDTEDVTATDGCIVEPDGHCEHGHQSWMLKLGII